MQKPGATRRRIKVTLAAPNLAAARKLGIDVSDVCDAALAEAVRRAKAEAWAQENAGALAERRSWIGMNGTPLADIQVLRID
jgi:antitoxin CcdA